MGVWANAKEIVDHLDRGVQIEGEETWLRAMKRIAKLPPELGAMLDEYGIGYRDVRLASYGKTPEEQARRAYAARDAVLARRERAGLAGRRFVEGSLVAKPSGTARAVRRATCATWNRLHRLQR